MLGEIIKMKDKLTGKRQPEKKKETYTPVKTVYHSNDVAIPDDFLTSLPADAQPITHTPVDFKPVLPD
ncbi:hypothetical protein ONZ43_g7780 [Nemania bipapillata]|uniref:Uncharacterized protein n=1 Tax=Nemania bipapillata TaxID=110536 RepID=A0ACC2HPD7_9PEZI|nr:hypothetical protein ONZ43_g7780 [Nemania bipapillata]